MIWLIALTRVEAGRSLLEELWRKNDEAYCFYIKRFYREIPSPAELPFLDSVIEPFLKRNDLKGTYLRLLIHRKSRDALELLKKDKEGKYLKGVLPVVGFLNFKTFLDYLCLLEKKNIFISITPLFFQDDTTIITIKIIAAPVLEEPYQRFDDFLQAYGNYKCEIDGFIPIGDTVSRVFRQICLVKKDFLRGKNCEILMKSLSHDSRMLTLHANLEEDSYKLIKRYVSPKRLSIPFTQSLYWLYSPISSFPYWEFAKKEESRKAWRRILEKKIEQLYFWFPGRDTLEEWERLQEEFLIPLARNLLEFLRLGGQVKCDEWDWYEFWKYLLTLPDGSAEKLQEVMNKRGYAWGKVLAYIFKDYPCAYEYVLEDLSEFSGISEAYLESLWGENNILLAIRDGRIDTLEFVREEPEEIFYTICVNLAEILRNVLKEEENIEKFKFIIKAIPYDTVIKAYINSIPCEKINEYLDKINLIYLPSPVIEILEKKEEKCGLKKRLTRKLESKKGMEDIERNKKKWEILCDSVRKYGWGRCSPKSVHKHREKVTKSREKLEKARMFLEKALKEALRLPGKERIKALKEIYKLSKWMGHRNLAKKIKKEYNLPEMEFREQLLCIKPEPWSYWEKESFQRFFYLGRYADSLTVEEIGRVILECAEKTSRPYLFPVYVVFNCVSERQMNLCED
ncbi:hypothetical protein DRQ18_04055, partial [bacterium]